MGGPAEQPVATSIRRVAVERDDIVFGRRPDCDQVLDYPMVSAQHARLRRARGELVIEDLGSANGTFLNGRRVAGPTRVKPGDRIGLGTYTFTLTADEGELEGQDLRGSASLEARNVTFEAGKRTLIEGISFTAYGGEFVGLMGPSGEKPRSLRSR
jgi:pSer/pThr/pTyr-binding forkhead associated (FHA) protein